MTDKHSPVKSNNYPKRILRFVHFYLYTLYKLFNRFKIPVLLITFSLFTLSVYFGKQTKIAVRTEDFSDQRLNSFKEMQELKKEYQFEDKLTLIVNKNSQFTSDDYCIIQNWLRKEVNQNQAIAGISSLFSLRKIDYQEGRLFYPLLIDSPCEKKVDLLKLANHPLTPLFSTKDLNDLIIHFDIEPSEKIFRHGIYDYKEIDSIIENAKKNLPFEIIPGGTLFFQSSVLKGIERTQILNIFASILLFSGYYIFYRSFLGAFALLSIIFIIHSFVKAGMAINGHMIDPLSSCIFLMLTVSALEDYIMLSFLVFKQKIPFNNAIKKLLLPSFLTSLTTAIGFGSLAVSNNPSIVHFAIWTATGAMLEWLAIFIIMPVFVNQFRWAKELIKNHPIPKRLVPKNLISYTPAKKISILLALIPLIIIFLYDKANLNYSPFDMFDSSHPISKFRQHFQKTRQSEGELSIVFNDKNFNVEKIVKKITLDPYVTHVFSEEDLESEISRLPNFLHTILKEDFQRTDLGKLFFSNETKRIIVSIKSYDTKDIPLIVRNLNQICSINCSVKSEVIVSKDYALGILQTLYESAISGFLSIILLIIFLVYAISKKHIIPVIASTLWASFMLLMFVVIFQFKINVVTCVALSVLIGLAGDNAIQFLLLRKNSLNSSVHEIGEASTENFILMLLLSSTLFLSYFETPRILALLMVVGISFMFIGDVWILNGLIAKTKKTKSK